LFTGSDQAVIEINETNDLATFALDFDELKEDEIVWAAGYGVQALSPGNFLPPGQLRMAKKRISSSLLNPKVLPLLPEELSAEKRYSSFAPGDSGGPVLRYKASRNIPFAPQYSIVGVLSFIDGLFYVDPDSGQITYAENLNDLPSGHFVRNYPERYLPWSFRFLSLKPLVWLQKFSPFSFNIAR
jgi:hypothetical protein